jgi:outer membrane biosynthesis protein TonB
VVPPEPAAPQPPEKRADPPVVQPKVENKPEPQPQAKPEPKPQAKPEAKPEPKPSADPSPPSPAPSPAAQARALWFKGLDAEAKQDYDEALKAYQAIKKLPPSVWYSSLDLRIEYCKKQLGGRD